MSAVSTLAESDVAAEFDLEAKLMFDEAELDSAEGRVTFAGDTGKCMDTVTPFC